MRNKIRFFIKTRLLFLYLLPLFFVFHNFISNYDLVSVKDAFLVLTTYIIAAIIISITGCWFFKNRYKAHLFGFLLLFINFFFGVVWDWLNEVAKNTILTNYSFLFSAILITLLIILIVLKRRQKIHARIREVLNVFLLLLLIVDTGWLILKMATKKHEIYFGDKVVLKPFTGKIKPDIYFIVADEYAGSNELKDIFKFDNSDFITALSQRGFHTLQNSTSNYNYTPFSIASTLNMAYLRLHTDYLKNNLVNTLLGIKKNHLISFLKNSGYSFYNYSIFQLEGAQNNKNVNDFFKGRELLTSSTLFHHLLTVIRFKLIFKRKNKFLDDGVIYKAQINNDNVYKNTVNLSKTSSNTPRFVYTHLVLPHHPYYFDKNGKPVTYEKLLEVSGSYSKKDYLEYLQYANKKFTLLIDEIQKNATSPPIIILMSDHGFRELNYQADKKYYFSNLISIHLPGNDYSKFYDGMSNVNLFRIFLNTQFEQNLALLKDSTSFMVE